jgi:geranylgeranyl pyrophosphate synthase
MNNDMMNTQYDKYYLSEIEKKLMEPVIYYYNIEGGDIRTSLTHYLGTLCSIDAKDINDVSQLIKLLHNATLVIDDIQDNSSLRRNKPCAHLKFGVSLTINSGYLTIFRVLMEIDKRSDISNELKSLIKENLYLGHIGQGSDIYYSSNKIVPSLSEYDQIMYYKTGLIFTMMLDALKDKLKSDNNRKNKKFLDNFFTLKLNLIKFSQFYQIRDDYINLTHKDYWEKRGFCQDFDEKKISYIIVYAKHNNVMFYTKIFDLLQLNSSREDKLEILKLMNDCGLFTNIYNLLIKLKTEILESLNIGYIFDKLPIHKFNYEIAVNYVKNNTLVK